MKQVTVSELLTKEQMEKVADIFDKRSSWDGIIAELKGYLRTLKPQLDKKGVVPDYLAYQIFYIASRSASDVLPDKNKNN